MSTSKEIILTGEDLQPSDVVAVAAQGAQVSFDAAAYTRMAASRAMVDTWVEEEKIVYGVTTGFGPFVSTVIPKKYQSDLQENLIRSHAANVGPLFSEEETRAAMLLRLNAFAKGFSAIRRETVDLLCAFLNRGIHPCIPQWGSVGASGDLNPSSHIALALMGEGSVRYEHQIMPTAEALEKAGLKQVKFMAKEGLALINGTTMMTGVGSLQVDRAWQLVRIAEIISAFAIEVLKGSAEPFLESAHRAKPHPGQLASVRNLNRLIAGTALAWDGDVVEKLRKELQDQMKAKDDVLETNVPLQNVYSLRATPQILGAVRDALTYVTARITTEMNSANDNPLFFPELGISYQGAHFHGQPVSLPLDVLTISLTEIGVLSERRLNKLLDPVRNNGLAPFLARGKAGLRCGLEGAQYIATSLVAECRTQCMPASVQSIPSNGENQDVVSMGLIAARKARDVAEKISYILAVELLAVCEAAEERDRTKLSPAAQAVYATVRETIAPYNEDRHMNPVLEAVRDLIHRGRILSSVEQALRGSLE